MKVAERERARTLRTQGKSINQIVKEIGVSKASASLWVRDIVLSDQQKNKLSEHGRSVASIEKRRLSRLANEHAKTRNVIENAKRDIKEISQKNLQLLGIALYMGEGGKTKKGIARIANSDPALIKMAMRFFREVCGVEECRFYAHIHTFSTTNVEKSERYWSQITGIPRRQFYKTYTKQSSASKQKRETVPYGTVEVGVNDTKLFLTIMGWIEKVKELVLE